MKEDTFEFKIRDELKMMAEFQDLQSALSKLTRVTRFKEEAAALHKSVSIEMIIDMIVYCSRGDMDLAIKSLRTSSKFVARCVKFYDSYYYACNLLLQIWKLGFITTRSLLDHEFRWILKPDVDEAEVEQTHEVLESVLVMMNEKELIQIAADVVYSAWSRLILITKINDTYESVLEKITKAMKERKIKDGEEEKNSKILILDVLFVSIQYHY